MLALYCFLQIGQRLRLQPIIRSAAVSGNMLHHVSGIVLLTHPRRKTQPANQISRSAHATPEGHLKAFVVGHLLVFVMQTKAFLTKRKPLCVRHA